MLIKVQRFEAENCWRFVIRCKREKNSLNIRSSRYSANIIEGL